MRAQRVSDLWSRVEPLLARVERPSRYIDREWGAVHRPDADYRVLEVAPHASDDEVRRAYRRMSMKHHPDKVAHLGPEFQKTATEKFQRVNAAYAAIRKSRGMA